MSSSYEYAAAQIVIYIGFLILISGLIGNTLNIIIFTSLKTFRQTSCALYLTAASFANILHLLANLLSRILITGYNTDLTKTSTVLCKLRQYVATIAPLMALSCMCFATVDQFASLTIRWRHFSQRHVACRLVTVAMIFWCLTNIPVIIYQYNYFSSTTNQWTCAITNTYFAIYNSRVYVPFLLGFVQLMIRISFGLLAFVNVRSLANRQTAIIRLERDKQITSMV
jgi:hypothetical protein